MVALHLHLIRSLGRASKMQSLILATKLQFRAFEVVVLHIEHRITWDMDIDAGGEYFGVGIGWVGRHSQSRVRPHKFNLHRTMPN